MHKMRRNENKDILFLLRTQLVLSYIYVLVILGGVLFLHGYTLACLFDFKNGNQIPQPRLDFIKFVLYFKVVLVGLQMLIPIFARDRTSDGKASGEV